MRCIPVLSILRRAAPAVAVAALAAGLPGAAGARGPGGVGAGVGTGGGFGGLGGVGVGVGGFGGLGGFRGGGGVFVPRAAAIAPFVAARPFGAAPPIPSLFDVRPFGFAPPGTFGFGGGFGAPFGVAPRSGFGFGAPGTFGFGSGFGYGPPGSFGFGSGFGYGPPGSFGFGSGFRYAPSGSFGFGTPSFGATGVVPRGGIVPGVGGAFALTPLGGGATVAPFRAAPAPLPVRPPAPVPAQVWRRDNGVWHLDGSPAPVAAWRLGEDGRWHAAAVR